MAGDPDGTAMADDPDGAAMADGPDDVDPELARPDELTHLDARGRARMVDVGGKDVTTRTASAQAQVVMRPDVAALLLAGDLPKGDAIPVARIAGIQAAKRTPELIPLCHQIALSSVQVDIEVDAGSGIVEGVATAKAADRTGVEMEALTACSVAALTIYAMCKSADRSMVIGDVTLWEKTGGRSGTYRRDPLDDAGVGVEGLGGLSGSDDDLGLGLDLDEES
jgi:cyclic pyranopterin monophosphate synthase